MIGRSGRSSKSSVEFLASHLSLTFNCSCLAHVINLATQKLISVYSTSPHFDPSKPEAHIPTTRDEVGLIRAIVVKVRLLYLKLKSNFVAYSHAGTLIGEA
jgi:hypothetical protein